MSRVLSRYCAATILSAAVHGWAFWAAGLVEPSPSISLDVQPPIELVTIVELEKPEPLAIASQPGVAPGIEDAGENKEPDDPTPEPVSPTPKVPKEEAPPEALAEPVAEPIPPTENRPSFAPSVNILPSVPNAGLIRVPQGKSPGSRASANPPRSKPGKQATTKRKGGRADERNPALLTALDRVLRQYYPNEAREAGIEGYTKLDLVVTRWGRPKSIRIVESHGHPAFGEACVRAVKRSRWRPAKDPAGRRIAMRVRFRCRFSVDPD